MPKSRVKKGSINGLVQHEFFKQFIQGFFFVAAQPWVYPGGLKDGAPGGGEPAETGWRIQPGNRAGRGIGCSDPAKRIEVQAQVGTINVFTKCGDTLLIDAVATFEKPRLFTEENDAQVQEFFPLHPRHQSYHGIFV